MANLELPQKLYFRIGEVARLLEVKPHVIRFWEKEFKSLRPKKSATGQRIFNRRDVERLSTIKHLLYTERFTIEGARKYLREHGFEVADAEPSAEQRTAERMKDGLLSVRAKLVSLLAQFDERKTGSGG
ncbi:MAG: MerR family transcriptional regulator [Polyangiales bacterium]